MAATVGVGSIFGGLAYGLFEQATYEQSAKEDASNYAIHAANKRNDACSKATDIEKPQCLKKEGTEYELDADDNRRDYADLVAQRKSALWTFIMGVAALIGMGLSVIGVVLVYTTFDETRKANVIARESMERQLRAYLVAADIKVINFKPGQSSKLEFTFLNSGQTPAKKVKSWTFGDIAGGATKDAKIRFDHSSPPTPLDVFNGQNLERTVPGVVTQEHYDRVISKEWRLIYAGAISYRDVFGGHHWCTFRTYLEPVLLDEDGCAKLVAYKSHT